MEKNQKSTETTFKMVVYFTQKSNGSYFNASEIQNNENVRWIGSYDVIRGKNKEWIRDEQTALSKQIKSLEQTLYGRYKTALIVVNNYKGYTIVLRKYVDGALKFSLGVRFYESDKKKGEFKIYNIPDADQLIYLYEKNALNDNQRKLIKPLDLSIMAAKPYFEKQKK